MKKQLKQEISASLFAFIETPLLSYNRNYVNTGIE